MQVREWERSVTLSRSKGRTFPDAGLTKKAYRCGNETALCFWAVWCTDTSHCFMNLIAAMKCLFCRVHFLSHFKLFYKNLILYNCSCPSIQATLHIFKTHNLSMCVPREAVLKASIRAETFIWPLWHLPLYGLRTGLRPRIEMPPRLCFLLNTVLNMRFILVQYKFKYKFLNANIQKYTEK